MLQRMTTTSPVTAPGRLTGWRRGLFTGANSALLRYILIIATLCAVGCLYYLQMNSLSNLHDQILGLQGQAESLEQRNIELARQWARWNTPSFIEAQADAAGYVIPDKIIHVGSATRADSGPAQ